MLANDICGKSCDTVSILIILNILTGYISTGYIATGIHFNWELRHIATGNWDILQLGYISTGTSNKSNKQGAIFQKAKTQLPQGQEGEKANLTPRVVVSIHRVTSLSLSPHGNLKSRTFGLKVTHGPEWTSPPTSFPKTCSPMLWLLLFVNNFSFWTTCQKG